MDSKDFTRLEDAYKFIYSESKKDESPEKEEEDRKKDDDLFGSPNKKNGKNGDDDKNGKNGKKKAKRWWDDDGDGKGYEKGEVKKEEYEVTAADKKGNTPAWQGYKAGKKNVKTGKPLYKAAAHLNKEQNELATKEIKDLQKGANTLKGKNIKKADKLADEVIHAKRALQEKQKDTPDQVKAVIAYDKARKGTDDATYDSEHGDKKQAKKERDYAKWQRDQGAEFAQKSGHPWEHAKGSTREKEGKKSEKHAHVKDSFEPSENITRLAESGRFSIEELWKIVEVEEGYQRNPEKGEAEERKAERDRKASGRMPPRGDKRREDFEKWYAANVR